jgi:hypothetical protein
MRLILIAFLLLAYPSFSYADGNEFLANCKVTLEMIDDKQTSGSAFSAGSCMGTIQGMRYMNSLYEPELSKEEAFFCIPEKAQAGQLIRVVVKYLQENPSKLHQHEALLITFAFSEVYSCT